MRSRAGVWSVVLFALAVPSHAYRMSAWVPSWDAKALTSMQLNAGNLDEANPGWYTIAADGTFSKNSNAEDPSLRAALTGIDLVPTIKNYVNGRFDGALVANVLASADLRARHADALTNLAVQNAYAGIDVDYESMTSDARANFTAFIQLLAQKLHAAGKTLSVTVHPKTSDGANWRGPAAQDWVAIGAVADSVKVMVYDEHWNGSGAGPITSLAWLDAVATYAESAIPARKIMIGLPWYGYDWVGTAATAVTWGDAMALAQNAGAQIVRDANGEPTFSYGSHTVYFQDATAYKRKTDLIAQKHSAIGGFAHWRAGAEDPSLWPAVAALKQSGSSPATPASGRFIVSGPATLVVRPASTVEGRYAVVVIDGFTGSVNARLEMIDAFPGSVAISPTAAAGGAATLTAVPSVAARPGQYRLRVRMTSGTLAADTVVTIEVTGSEARRRSARH